jgi:hypothetical protein
MSSHFNLNTHSKRGSEEYLSLQHFASETRERERGRERGSERERESVREREGGREGEREFV